MTKQCMKPDGLVKEQRNQRAGGDPAVPACQSQPCILVGDRSAGCETRENKEEGRRYGHERGEKG